MAVSPYALFLRQNAGNKLLSKLSVAQRGKATGKLFNSLAPAARLQLNKAAKATKRFPLTKVCPSVLGQAVRRGIPLANVRESWYKTKGTTTVGRLNKIAAAAKIQVRTPAKYEAFLVRQAENKKKRAALQKKGSSSKKAAGEKKGVSKK